MIDQGCHKAQLLSSPAVWASVSPATPLYPPAAPTHQPSRASQTDKGRKDQQMGSQNAPGRHRPQGWEEAWGRVRGGGSQTDSERLVLHLSGLAVSPCPVKRIRRMSEFRWQLGGYSVGLLCPLKALPHSPTHKLPSKCWV